MKRIATHHVATKGVATVGLLLLLAACGSGSGGSGSGSDSGSPKAAATDSSKAGTTDSSKPTAKDTSTMDAGGSDDANPVDGPTFCAFLAKEESRVKGSGAPAGAEAFFAIDLATWIGEHPDQKPRTGADLDDASQKSCPKSRAIITTAMGATSFADALG